MAWLPDASDTDPRFGLALDDLVVLAVGGGEPAPPAEVRTGGTTRGRPTRRAELRHLGLARAERGRGSSAVSASARFHPARGHRFSSTY